MLLQSLLRPVLTPLMRGMFDAPIASSSAWSPLALWPLGAASPGLWIDPPYAASLFSTSAGTTAISAIGTLLDTSNPVGLVLDRKGGATALADPGIHLSQATATSRPVASARVNLLTKTEDFSAWELSVGASAVGTTITLPAGGGCSKYFTAVQNMYFSQHCVVTGSGTVGISIMTSGYVGLATQTVVLSAVPQVVVLTASTASYTLVGTRFTSAAGATVTSLETQLNLGSTALPYQRVGAASDYDASAGPTYTKLDGTDDGWLSATFTANTAFTDGMDALIAVRRDSTANAVCGLYQSVAEANKVFGIAESGSGSGCVGSGAGTPTVLVDGTQLAGGTAVTRGTLHTALTPGAWHILEFRNLDLSTWTAVGFGLYTSYVLNGALGGIQLFASGQDANRDKARIAMADYFGVTLP